MNIHVSDDAEQTARGEKPKSASCCFLLTPTQESCAVEIFTKKLIDELRTHCSNQQFELLSVAPLWRNPLLVRQIASADTIVFSLPLVAWKRMLLTPLVILLVATLVRCRVVVFVHEWKALHRLRRFVLAPIVAFAQVIITVSPFIAKQLTDEVWLTGATSKCRLVPHPPTIRPTWNTTITERVENVRRAAKACDIVIGHFGSLYRGKAAIALLDICKHLKDRGVRALVVFIGTFIKSLENYDQEFWSKASELDIGDQIIVTGYIQREAELYALFEEIEVFLFLFPEGLTARRSSVIACLQSDRPVVTSAPQSATEFVHHQGFRRLIEANVLSFIPLGADIGTVADLVLTAATQEKRDAPAIDPDAWWAATVDATLAALLEDPGRPKYTSISRENRC
jgi:glycosyltransferase involved in cell wall biosynthesis